MLPAIETLTPPNTPRPIGPYSHIAKAGQLIFVSALAGMDPATGKLVGPDAASQTKQILELFKVMLASAGSDLNHVLHISVFLKDMRDFEDMNRAYAEGLGDHRPARTVIEVNEVPKPGARLTMNLTAIRSESAETR